MELREKIAQIIYSAVGEVSNEPNLVDTGEAADAILAIPEIRDALASNAALANLVAAVDSPRFGDDSIWDDLLGFSAEDGGPLGRARALVLNAQP